MCLVARVCLECDSHFCQAGLIRVEVRFCDVFGGLHGVRHAKVRSCLLACMSEQNSQIRNY